MSGPGNGHATAHLALVHRRLAIAMGLAGLMAFGAGVGITVISPLVASLVLVVAYYWRPSPSLSASLEHLWLPLAFLLVLRALYHVVVVGDDVVIPVVDLLLLLLCAEVLRPLDAPNDVRLYALSFALLLASTAYRPGIVFAFAFVTYVFVSTLALIAGHLRRKLRRYGSEDFPLGRPVLLTTTALSAVTLLASVIVFLTFPRVSQGWTGRGETMATSVAGFSDVVSIGEFGSQIYANPEIVLRVEFSEGLPSDYPTLHWRGRSYDRFDGVRWLRSERVRPSAGATNWYRERWPGPLVPQRIYGAPLDVRALFGLHPVVRVEPESPIHPLRDNVGDLFYWGNGPPAYTAWSPAGHPTPDELRAAETGFMPDRTHYLQLPRLPDRIHALADSLTRDHETRYDKVVAIERWLRTEFAYTLELPATAQEATLDHFLFERRAGHCEYFSTAMAVLLRTLGIHARNINGFLGGNWSQFGRYLAVTQNQAHSWVEVWFPGYGWVTFDPTPAGASTTLGGTIWFWPGRLFVDALQHRWGKWVLDYSIQNQTDVLGRTLAFLREDRQTANPVAVETSWKAWILWILAAALVVGWTVWYLRRRRMAGSPETRFYLGLLESCRQAGLVRSGQIAPLELVERLGTQGNPAASPASRLVEIYLRGRFAGEPLSESEHSAMSQALAGARRALERRPRDGRAPG